MIRISSIKNVSFSQDKNCKKMILFSMVYQNITLKQNKWMFSAESYGMEVLRNLEPVEIQQVIQ